MNDELLTNYFSSKDGQGETVFNSDTGLYEKTLSPARQNLLDLRENPFEGPENVDMKENISKERELSQEEPVTSLYNLNQEGNTSALKTYLDEKSKGKVDVAKDIGRGIFKGLVNLYMGAASYPLAIAESKGWVDEGTINEWGGSLENYISSLGETETIAGGLAEGISQYLVPGLGYYKLFGALMKTPQIARVMFAVTKGNKTTANLIKLGATEIATVGTASNPDDGNLLGFVMDIIPGLDKTKAEGIAREFVNEIANSEGEWTASDVLETKFKNILGDFFPAMALEAALPAAIGLLVATAQGLRQAAKNPKLVEEVIGIEQFKQFEAEGPFKPEFEVNDSPYDGVSLMNMDNNPIVPSNGKKVRIDDIVSHFDEGEKLDIYNDVDYNKIVDKGLNEISYQVNQDITGMGWYDTDVKKAMESLPRINAAYKDNQNNQDLLVFLTAISSPNVAVGKDMEVGAKMMNELFDNSSNRAIPNTNPNSRYTEKDIAEYKKNAKGKEINVKVGDAKGWTSRPHLKTQLVFVDNYITQYGVGEFIKFIDKPTTRRELNTLRESYGLNKISGKLDEEIIGADMFGPKVSKFMQNLLGLSDENVPDVWFTRGFNRKSGNMYAGKDGNTIVMQPRNDAERAVMDRYIVSIRDKLNEKYNFTLSNKDAQAVLWYFEQRLYTKLGVKSEPKSYADTIEKLIPKGN